MLADISNVSGNSHLGPVSNDWHYGPSCCQATGYTTLTVVAPNVVLLTYDRLARGWSYPPGPFWAEDAVFSVRAHVQLS